MGQKQTGRFCAHCQANTMATAQAPNHVLHLLLTLFTMGLWFIPWILIASATGTFRCTKCGSKV